MRPLDATPSYRNTLAQNDFADNQNNAYGTSCTACSGVFFLLTHLDGQQPDRTIREAAVPFYPPVARVARIQGTVVLEVTTIDGSVADASPVKGNPVLAKAAAANIRSWIFVNHMQMTFKVIFKYRLSSSCAGDPNIQMSFPTKVEVCSKPFPPLE